MFMESLIPYPHRQMIDKLADEYFSDLAELDREVQRRTQAVDNREEHGSSNSEAAQAVQFLANPKLKSTHPNLTQKRLDCTANKARDIAMKAIADAVYKAILADQAKLEASQFRDDRSAAGPVAALREGDPGNIYEPRYLEPLIGKLVDRGVAPSAFSRAPRWINTLVAHMYDNIHRDPKLENSTNILVRMAKAGIFEAYRDGMSDEEAAAVSTAQSMAEDPEVIELRRAFNADHGGRPAVSTPFLRGCAQVAKYKGILPPGLSELYRNSLVITRQNDAKVVSEILGLSAEEQDVAEVVAEQLWMTTHDSRLKEFHKSTVFTLISHMIEDVSPTTGETYEWLPQFVARITEIAEQVQGVVRSEQTFLAIMYAAFEHSIAKAKFKQIIDREKLQERAKLVQQSVDEALESGKPFKFDPCGYAITEDDPEFHYIPQKPLTKETYFESALAQVGINPFDAEYRYDGDEENDESSLEELAGLSQDTSELDDMPAEQTASLEADIADPSGKDTSNASLFEDLPEVSRKELGDVSTDANSPPKVRHKIPEILGTGPASFSVEENSDEPDFAASKSGPQSQNAAAEQQLPTPTNRSQKMLPMLAEYIDDEDMI